MAYAQKLPTWISPEDYLMLEERSLEKHEYLDGVIYDWQAGGIVAMAGADKRHNRASLNIYTSLRSQLRGEPCELFVADVRVAVDDKSVYFYPDVVLSCSATDRASERTIREPLLIVEVLSPSTELFDRCSKFEGYQRFQSLQTYVLVLPAQHMIEVFTRAGGWVRTEQTECARVMSSETVDLGVHGLRLLAADVFEGVPFGDRA